jgi:malate dehydrogenase (oxaloacetate-decarboxylating)(NADP+)
MTFESLCGIPPTCRKFLHTPVDDQVLGSAVLQDPARNKGTAFTEEERDQLGLRGLLPPRVLSQDAQLEKVLESFRGKTSDLEKYVYLMSLQDRNERLFYQLVTAHLAETLPIIYTPTVGQACQRYAHLWRRPRGLYISAHDRGRIERVMRNWPTRDVRIIVVTDGERILGLGDLGANGMGIPVGKLSLYTACAGIQPSWCLPITLDVGTENEGLLDDPLYLGLPQRRLRGQAYDALIEEFMQAAAAVFPRAIVQFEDFGNANAFRLLARYRDRACCFNDDIQGTAAVTLAGLWSSLRIADGRSLSSQTLLFVGAGEAGTGIADLVVRAMIDEGLGEADSRRRCWFVDSKGLVVRGRGDLATHKLPYAHEHEPISELVAAVRGIRPSAIIGVSGQPNAFTRDVIDAMASINMRPIIFALSNPTSRSECTATQAYQWSSGRAIFASGSPFAPVPYHGQSFVPGQANNAYIFPGVGLGAIACGATRMTDEMFMSAARTLAGMVRPSDLASGCTFPALERIREISVAIATGVVDVAVRQALASVEVPADIRSSIERLMYRPQYADCDG